MPKGDMSVFLKYIHDFTPHLPIGHWVVMVMISLVITILLQKRYGATFYGGSALGITILFGLFLLDALTINRFGSNVHLQYSGLDLNAELHRMINHTDATQVSMLFNVMAFIPFGMFLSEYLIVVRQFNCKRCIRCIALIAFGLSFCIEILQFVLEVGFLELTDMFLNTVGAVLGAAIAMETRNLFSSFRRNSE